MNLRKLVAIAALSMIVGLTPAMAQRGGGGSGSRGGSGGHSSSSSSSRGSSGGSHSSSSSPRSGGSYSSPSRSSSTPSRSSVSSSPSRSGSTTYRSGSSSPSRSGIGSSSRSTTSRNDMGSSRRGGGRSDVSGGNNNRRSSGTVGRPSSTAPSNHATATRSSRNTRSTEGMPGSNVRGGGTTPGGTPSNGGRQAGRSSTHPQNGQGHRYARPGQPGHMPPSHRPMHPAPYFHHPYHHGHIHMRPVVWVHPPLRPLFWPGFWVYCNSYWYDYHVTDVTIVHKYVQDTYNMDMVSYVVSGDIMYAIVHDVDGKTYLQVYDNSDKMLAEPEISKKYIKTEIDRENGGCWIFKKKDKDPMLFLYVDGELLIYEAD